MVKAVPTMMHVNLERTTSCHLPFPYEEMLSSLAMVAFHQVISTHANETEKR